MTGNAPSRTWEADTELSEEEAADLIATQFPQLAPARLQAMGVGWDNAAFRVNERYVFRFPRRKIAAALIAREEKVLPRLAPALPLPIPVPLFPGRPQGAYPYPFAGYAYIPGTTACLRDWSEEERAQNAQPLARFLAALHGIPVDIETLAWAPRDDIRRADLPFRTAKAKERLNRIAGYLEEKKSESLVTILDRLAATPLWEKPLCWVHGDLYARHLLVNEGHQLCGVIDWGDVHLGDPALDLMIAFSFLPPAARPPFREAYGPIDAATWDRARFRALCYGITLIDYGLDVGDEAIKRAGEYALHAISP
ncbi:MAG TPA: phosphotransferase [Chthonomonadaceae bacterium]|nr:phosphotransferase [Chthonomonadaceae bacterium]